MSVTAPIFPSPVARVLNPAVGTLSGIGCFMTYITHKAGQLVFRKMKIRRGPCQLILYDS